MQLQGKAAGGHKGAFFDRFDPGDVEGRVHFHGPAEVEAEGEAHHSRVNDLGNWERTDESGHHFGGISLSKKAKSDLLTWAVAEDWDAAPVSGPPVAGRGVYQAFSQVQ